MFPVPPPYPLEGSHPCHASPPTVTLAPYLAAAYRDSGGWGCPATLDPFTNFLRGYVDALFSLAHDEDGTPWDESEDAPGIYQLAPEAQAAIIERARAFFRTNCGRLTVRAERYGVPYDQAGTDLALDEQGAGTGAEDRNGPSGSILAARAAARYSEGLYEGDDGLAYLMAS